MSWETTEVLYQLKETSRMIWRSMTHGGLVESRGGSAAKRGRGCGGQGGGRRRWDTRPEGDRGFPFAPQRAKLPPSRRKRSSP